MPVDAESYDFRSMYVDGGVYVANDVFSHIEYFDGMPTLREIPRNDARPYGRLVCDQFARKLAVGVLRRCDINKKNVDHMLPQGVIGKAWYSFINSAIPSSNEYRASNPALRSRSLEMI